jgi:hypothetical protein
MADKGPDTLKIEYRLDQGVPGRDDDPKNPISRALATLMKDNSRLPSFAQTFLVDETPGEPWRWLGVFVKSAGDRILFFPGFKATIDRVRGSRGEVLQFDQKFEFDHMSLEKDRGSWHVTSVRSKDHLPPARRHASRPLPKDRLPATDLGAGRVLWFGMSLASTEVMRELRKETVATFDVPSRTAEWKCKQFIQSRDGKEFPALQMPEKPAQAQGSIFPLISMIVGPTDFEQYRGPVWGWPYGSEFVRGEPSGDWNYPSRDQRFHLDEETDIQLTAIWAPGSLVIPAVLTASENQPGG